MAMKVSFLGETPDYARAIPKSDLASADAITQGGAAAHWQRERLGDKVENDSSMGAALDFARVRRCPPSRC